jgi:hypothetical protein
MLFLLFSYSFSTALIGFFNNYYYYYFHRLLLHEYSGLEDTDERKKWKN